MSEFTSLSTGCFIVKPSKLKDDSLYPTLYEEESTEDRLERQNIYHNILAQLEKSVDAVVTEVTGSIVDAITNFVDSSLVQTDFLRVPTLTVKVGVNFREFKGVHQSSSKILSEKHQMKTVIIDPSAGQEIATLVKCIFQQVLVSGDLEEKILTKTLLLRDLFSHLSDSSTGLVVFLPRFDAIPSQTTDKLITICHSAAAEVRFPLLFVFGLASGLELSAEWLSCTSLSLLKVTPTDVISPTLLLERVLQSSLLSPSLPFKLSYRSFEVLLSRFSMVNFSLKDVLKTVRVALLRHCLSQPLLKLTKPGNTLREEEKALLLQLPSVQSEVERLVVSDKARALRLLDGEDEVIKELSRDLDTNYRVLFHTFQVLQVLVRDLPGNALVSKPLELYSLCLGGQVNTVPEVKVALKCFAMLQREAFLERLQDALAVCEEVIQPAPQMIQALTHVLRAEVETLSGMETGEECKEEQRIFSSRISDFLGMIKAPTSWPLHEVLWATDQVVLNNLLVGRCRATLHRALTSPHIYLQGPDETVRPDLCHLFELFQEHGRLISLHDWIQSYGAALGAKRLTNEIHARFIRGVSELQFMGYLKPTKRKTDHVAKLSLVGY